MAKHYWLLKSEPDTFSIQDLVKAPKQSTGWEGVRNYQARNYIRDDIKVNDLCFFYHSSCPTPAIVGIVAVTKACHPDETALDPKSPYYDPKSTHDSPRWYQMTVQLKEEFIKPVSLQILKGNPQLAEMPLLRKGNRLSITPVLPSQWQTILKMAQSL